MKELFKKNIFNRKNLKQILDKIQSSDIPEYRSKMNIISHWADTIANGKIFQLNETSIGGQFLNDIFSKVLNYKDPISSSKWNLVAEKKPEFGTGEADGALGFFSYFEETRKTKSDVRAVIELKGADVNLDTPQNRQADKRTPVEQAFSYSNTSGKKCKWIIVSNFITIRLYHHDTINEYEEFDVKELVNWENFNRFYYLLNFNNLIKETGDSIIDEIYSKNQEEENNISNEFYKEYKTSRIKLLNHLIENNPQISTTILLEKSQKFLDRFIFICFCEDNKLLPSQTYRTLVEQSIKSFSFSDTKVWEQLKGLFKAIDVGSPPHDINKFNGGLFAYDEILDNLIIKDKILESLVKITDYDFDSDIDVNILGHIFEQSLSDLEEIKAELSGETTDKNKSKRKKDGIFYTPEYITKYIVENAVGGWLEDRKIELGYNELPALPEILDYSQKTGIFLDAIELAKKENLTDIEKHIVFWYKYLEKLQNIKILDPACGSGAFLNQAFNYLYHENRKVYNELSHLLDENIDNIQLPNIILNNNLFGVDLNSESVEITKLSLWLKTANRSTVLAGLDNNIKCGNSLIDDPEIAGDKAFKWEIELKEIMDNGGFDVIIGNPPYVDNRGFNKKELNYLFSKYNNSFQKSGTNDFKTTKLNLISPFIEKASKVISNGGNISFLFHKNILKTNAYASIRKYILNNFKIRSITDWGAKQFEDVVAETASFVLIKTKLFEDNIYVDYFEKNINKKFTIQSQNSYINNYDYIFSISSDLNEKETLKKIENNSELIEKFIYINNGIVTGNDKKYLSYFKENQKFKSAIRGRDIKRYNTPQIEEFVYYDKDKLLRARDENIFLAKEKLIMQMINIEFILTYDEQCLYNLGTTYAITKKQESGLKLKYILSILNSKLMSFYYKKKYTNISTLTNAISTKNLFNLPIKNISSHDQQPFITFVDIMIERNKELHETKNKFLNLMKDEFQINKISSKLESWYLLNWQDLLAELKKVKIELRGEVKEEWKERFDRLGAKAKEIKTVIDTTDKEIDQMVYKLYDLTEEEIKIVEGEG